MTTTPKNRLIFFASIRGKKVKAALERAKWPLVYYEVASQMPRLVRLRILLNVLTAIVCNPKPSLVMVDHLGLYPLIIETVAHLAGVRFAVRLRGDVWLESKETISNQKGLYRVRFWLRLQASNILIGRSDFLLPVSKFLGERAIEELQVDNEKIVILPVFVDVAEFQTNNSNNDVGQLKQYLGCGSTDHIILSVTNFNYFDKARGLVEYIPAFNELSTRDQTVHWVIAGDGIYFNDVKKEILTKTLYPDRIKLIGRTIEVANWYKVCDFLLHFSFADTIPNVVLEAGASGKACLANKFGGMREHIIHGTTGFLVETDELGEVINASSKLLYDSACREQLGQQALARIKRMYTVQAVGDLFEQNMLHRIPYQDIVICD